jgi:4-amino-4-deoxychorismate lyase
MCRLLETIQIRQGEVLNLDRHVARMNKSRRELFSCQDEVAGAAVLAGLSIPVDGVWKLRVVYGVRIERQELKRYVVQKVRSLKLVHDDTIEYSHKYEDRSAIDALMAQRGSCDNILIVKNGCVTDTAYANIAFSDGGEWFTPETPLLAGIQRAALIAEGKLKERRIKPEDLKRYQSAMLINAMLRWGDAEPIDIAAIVS